MLKLFGLLLVLHGLAHAGAGMWATGSPLIVTPLWWAASLGFVAAGIGVLGIEPFRNAAHRLLVGAALASVLLLYFFPSVLVVPGLALDLALVTLATRGRLAARIAVLPFEESRHRVASPLAVAFLVYASAVIVARPWCMRMGSTAEERRAAVFGDTLYPDARYIVDNAITIEAPADSVWPWLAQIGQDRAGFYSYESLENLVGARIHNADSIVPAWQDRHTGDLVRAVPPDYLGGRLGRNLGWRIVAMDPGRAMVLENWGAFTLRPVDANTTRLHIRQRNPGRPSLLGTVASPAGLFLFEPAHFIMQRGMMRGIRKRAERRAA